MAKFVSLSGVTAIWTAVKTHVSNSIKAAVTDKLGAASGIATLGSDSKLTASQLPALKTVNGKSIVGSGDVTIDLSLYKIVSSLPTSSIDANKIYLVADASGEDSNVYKEYIYVSNKWELLGEYKADVNLAPYLKKDSLADGVTIVPNKTIVNFTFEATTPDKGKETYATAFIEQATSDSAGVMTAADKANLDAAVAKLAGIDSGANKYVLEKAGANLGGVKTGYTANGKNYPLAVDNDGKAYVNVPWVNTGTDDTALTDAEINAVLV